MNLWVFDNDGTLYDDREASRQFFKISNPYFGQLLGIAPEKVETKAQELKKKWGTQFAFMALVKESGVDFTRAVNDVHLKIDLEACGIATPDTLRRRVISNLSGRKVVFTNNPSTFARKVLAHVGLLNLFSDIIGMEEMRLNRKPSPHSFQEVEKRHPNAHRIIFCDNQLENLVEARRQGWITVWHKPENADKELGNGHIVIDSFEEFADAVSPLT